MEEVDEVIVPKEMVKEAAEKKGRKHYNDEAYLAMTPEEKKKERIRRRKAAKAKVAD